MPSDIFTQVQRNEDLGHGNYLLEFEHGPTAAEMQPGQFFMIGIPGSETLLRRPYSVCGLPGTFAHRSTKALQVLYRTYGKGTTLLASLSPGATIRVLGPLGRGFTAPADGSRPVFVAGGIGSAPFPAFARRLPASTPRPRMFYGARRAVELPLLDWFREHCDVAVTTEDGSLGHRGRVTEPLADLLAAHPREAVTLYACGPEPMLRAVHRLALNHDVPAQLALEAHMACGFGVCLGCVVPTHGAGGRMRYERVCVEGPVMAATRVAW